MSDGINNIDFTMTGDAGDLLREQQKVVAGEKAIDRAAADAGRGMRRGSEEMSRELRRTAEQAQRTAQSIQVGFREARSPLQRPAYAWRNPSLSDLGSYYARQERYVSPERMRMFRARESQYIEPARFRGYDVADPSMVQFARFQQAQGLRSERQVARDRMAGDTLLGQRRAADDLSAQFAQNRMERIAAERQRFRQRLSSGIQGTGMAAFAGVMAADWALSRLEGTLDRIGGAFTQFEGNLTELVSLGQNVQRQPGLRQEMLGTAIARGRRPEDVIYARSEFEQAISGIEPQSQKGLWDASILTTAVKGGDLATNVSAQIKQWQNFGKFFRDPMEAANFLAFTEAEGTIRMSELAEQVPQAFPVWAQAGFRPADLAATIQTASVRLPTDQIFAQIRNLPNRMGKAEEQFGVELEGSIAEQFQQLSQAIQGMDHRELRRKLHKAFEDRGMALATALLQNVDELTKNLEKFAVGQGAYLQDLHRGRLTDPAARDAVAAQSVGALRENVDVLRGQNADIRRQDLDMQLRQIGYKSQLSPAMEAITPEWAQRLWTSGAMAHINPGYKRLSDEMLGLGVAQTIGQKIAAGDPASLYEADLLKLRYGKETDTYYTDAAGKKQFTGEREASVFADLVGKMGYTDLISGEFTDYLTRSGRADRAEEWRGAIQDDIKAMEKEPRTPAIDQMLNRAKGLLDEIPKERESAKKYLEDVGRPRQKAFDIEVDELKASQQLVDRQRGAVAEVAMGKQRGVYYAQGGELRATGAEESVALANLYAKGYGDLDAQEYATVKTAMGIDSARAKKLMNYLGKTGVDKGGLGFDVQTVWREANSALRDAGVGAKSREHGERALQNFDASGTRLGQEILDAGQVPTTQNSRDVNLQDTAVGRTGGNLIASLLVPGRIAQLQAQQQGLREQFGKTSLELTQTPQDKQGPLWESLEKLNKEISELGEQIAVLAKKRDEAASNLPDLIGGFRRAMEFVAQHGKPFQAPDGTGKARLKNRRDQKAVDEYQEDLEKRLDNPLLTPDQRHDLQKEQRRVEGIEKNLQGERNRLEGKPVGEEGAPPATSREEYLGAVKERRDAMGEFARTRGQGDPEKSNAARKRWMNADERVKEFEKGLRGAVGDQESSRRGFHEARTSEDDYVRGERRQLYDDWQGSIAELRDAKERRDPEAIKEARQRAQEANKAFRNSRKPEWYGQKLNEARKITAGKREEWEAARKRTAEMRETLNAGRWQEHREMAERSGATPGTMSITLPDGQTVTRKPGDVKPPEPGTMSIVGPDGKRVARKGGDPTFTPGRIYFKDETGKETIKDTLGGRVLAESVVPTTLPTTQPSTQPSPEAASVDPWKAERLERIRQLIEGDKGQPFSGMGEFKQADEAAMPQGQAFGGFAGLKSADEALVSQMTRGQPFGNTADLKRADEMAIQAKDEESSAIKLDTSGLEKVATQLSEGLKAQAEATKALVSVVEKMQGGGRRPVSRVTNAHH